jgi:hypothetical protein
VMFVPVTNPHNRPVAYAGFGNARPFISAPPRRSEMMHPQHRFAASSSAFSEVSR